MKLCDCMHGLRLWVVLIMSLFIILNLLNDEQSYWCLPLCLPLQLSSVTSSLTEQILSHLFSQVQRQRVNNVFFFKVYICKMYFIIVSKHNRIFQTYLVCCKKKKKILPGHLFCIIFWAFLVAFDKNGHFLVGGAVSEHRSSAVSQRPHLQSL